jgi:hypothetical protein
MQKILLAIGSPRTLPVAIGPTPALLVLGILLHESGQVMRLVNPALKLMTALNLLLCVNLLARSHTMRKRRLDTLSHLPKNFDDHHSTQN